MYFPATLTKTGWNGVGVHFTFPVHSLSAYRTAKVTRNKISLASGLEYNFITSESVRIFATDRSPGVLGSDEHQMPQRASLHCVNSILHTKNCKLFDTQSVSK